MNLPKVNIPPITDAKGSEEEESPEDAQKWPLVQFPTSPFHPKLYEQSLLSSIFGLLSAHQNHPLRSVYIIVSASLHIF
jgi:hypothetical protein